MASKDWGQFSSYWGSYCKDTIKQLWKGDQCTHFSEGLLNTLCYETDVGCIPRGVNLDTTTQSKYFKSNNWNKQISNCYWCKGDSTKYNGICCSKECFFYLHDWCVERVVYFTGRQFCRLPGCDSNTQNNQLYCDDTDRAKFDSLFPKGSDHIYTVKTVIRDGPSWYDSKENFVTHSQNNNNSHNKMENKKTSSISPFNSDFPTELQELISLQTDIGIIPRDSFNLFDLEPKFSHYANWSTPIKGCYDCGRIDIIDSTNKYFCSVRCYLMFYEWCRSKVKSVTGIRFCRYAGCAKRASEGNPCCNNGHEIDINKLYKDNSIDDIVRLSNMTPKWYTKSSSPNEPVSILSAKQTNSQTPSKSKQPPQQPNCGPNFVSSPNEPVPLLSSKPTNSQTPSESKQPTQQPNCGPNFVFSSELTKYLYHHTDVGPIPREIKPHRSPPVGVPLLNWNTNITMCYWCCQGPRIFNTIACSLKCLFLFNEWLHRIYETSSNQQLCKSIGCNSLRYPGFKCCNREHSYSYDLSFKQFYPSLKSTEFALGPIWYTDSKITRIEFYNREDPFYEFTNFYPCDDLYIDGLRWRTSEHYFQAMKFYGTPYFKYISTLNSPRDAFQFSRTPLATKWLHHQWPGVKLQVMLKVLRVKFSSKYFRTILLRTGNAMLIEHTRNDKFWGDGGDGRGENKLGKLLMQVRREFQATNEPVYQQNPMLQINSDQISLSCGLYNQSTPQVANSVCINTAHQDSTDSTCISNNADSTNPFVGFSYGPDEISVQNTDNSNRPFFISNVPPVEVITYGAKHDLPEDYSCPYSNNDIESLKMDADKHASSPELMIQDHSTSDNNRDYGKMNPFIEILKSQQKHVDYNATAELDDQQVSQETNEPKPQSFQTDQSDSGIPFA